MVLRLTSLLPPRVNSFRLLRTKDLEIKQSISTRRNCKLLVILFKLNYLRFMSEEIEALTEAIQLEKENLLNLMLERLGYI